VEKYNAGPGYVTGPADLPGWRRETWEEYADHSLTHDDLSRRHAVEQAIRRAKGRLPWRRRAARG
jgi:hypothetical protein